ncbi:sulfatase-like hydrolase/transferase [Kribbella shirazensis]|nr:sulfatase-like hydrolase/transferase [Kribbella shirazensis]
MASSDPDRPNFVVVVTDDQGPWALGCQGNAELQTPAIDALAGRGVRFESFFCASPVCSPARASLLTGRMPSAHGVHDWIRGEAYGLMDEESYLTGLTTTPQVLADNGWRCGHTGKWHLGDARRPAPGFTEWYAHRTGDGPYVGAPIWRDGQRVAEDRYITTAITDEAVRFVDSAAAGPDPFYLQVHYTAPHSPWVGQHPAEYLDRYADCAFDSCPRPEPDPWFSWEPGPISDAMRDPRPSLQGYFASITAVDDGVDRLMRTLAEHQLVESTVVVFTSDNGFSCGHHGIWGKGNATNPLNMWENSVRVPFIVSQPGRLRSGAVESGLAGACDLHPTLLRLAGVPVPEDPLAAGRSLLPQLTDGADGADGAEHVIVFDEYGGTRMVRTVEWKLVQRYGDAPGELYDLGDDPAEEHNLIDDPSRRAVVAELAGVLTDWFSRHIDEQLDAYSRPISGRGQLHPVRRGTPDAETYYAGTTEIRSGARTS